MYLNRCTREKAHTVDLGFLQDPQFGPAWRICGGDIRSILHFVRLGRWYIGEIWHLGGIWAVNAGGGNWLSVKGLLQSGQPLPNYPTLRCDVAKANDLGRLTFESVT